MSKRRRDEANVHVSQDGDVVTSPEGYKTLSINWYIRNAKTAGAERAWYDAWLHYGSALARATNGAEISDLRQLERDAWKRFHPRKGHKKKDEDKRGKRREYA